jgi:hypothetical protein
VILCDREIQLALRERRIIIHPPPDPAFIDATTAAAPKFRTSNH